MTGPKHLWSGNWQQESSEPPAEAITPAPAQTELTIRRPRRKLWRSAAPLIAVALLAGVALAWIVTGGSPGRHSPGNQNSSAASLFPNTTGPALTSPSATATTPASPPTGLTGHSVGWLGMEISTVQNGGAVIQTVALGSPADVAGLEPGDVIQTVNRHSITAADQILTAVAGLKQGQAVGITVERGSTLVSTIAGIQGRPTTSP